MKIILLALIATFGVLAQVSAKECTTEVRSQAIIDAAVEGLKKIDRSDNPYQAGLTLESFENRPLLCSYTKSEDTSGGVIQEMTVLFKEVTVSLWGYEDEEDSHSEVVECSVDLRNDYDEGWEAIYITCPELHLELELD